MSIRHGLDGTWGRRTKRLLPWLMMPLLWAPVLHAAEGDLIALPKAQFRGLALEQALSKRRTVRLFAQRPVGMDALSQLLWAAQGITGADGLRTAPSAGALYPLEIDVVAGAVAGLSAGVYRYLPEKHALQRVLDNDRREELARAALGQWWMRDAAVMIVISAVAVRTERKYGSRATLYVPFEAGAAAQNVLLQAVSLGLSAATVGAFNPQSVRSLLGAKAGEEPLAILPVGRAP